MAVATPNTPQRLHMEFYAPGQIQRTARQWGSAPQQLENGVIGVVSGMISGGTLRLPSHLRTPLRRQLIALQNLLDQTI